MTKSKSIKPTEIVFDYRSARKTTYKTQIRPKNRLKTLTNNMDLQLVLQQILKKVKPFMWQLIGTGAT